MGQEVDRTSYRTSEQKRKLKQGLETKEKAILVH
jgi:hypothetical protein